MSNVLRQETPELARIVLANGDEGNRLTAEDLDALEDSIKHVQHHDVPLLVIEQRGRDFCAGREPAPLSVARRGVLSSIVRRLREVEAVTVGVARGAVTGFGVGLFAQTDISLAGTSARFSFPEVRKGHAPALVASWLFDLVPRKRALEWIMTGRTFDGDEAVAAGLVTRCVPDVHLADERDRVIAQLSGLDHQVLRECRTLAEIMGSGAVDRRSQESIAVKWLTAASAR